MSDIAKELDALMGGDDWESLTESEKDGARDAIEQLKFFDSLVDSIEKQVEESKKKA